MTVMNFRAQGGSSFKNGRVELVLNRRFYRDDDKGLAEPMNEKGSDGKPLSVSTNYLL